MVAEKRDNAEAAERLMDQLCELETILGDLAFFMNRLGEHARATDIDTVKEAQRVLVEAMNGFANATGYGIATDGDGLAVRADAGMAAVPPTVSGRAAQGQRQLTLAVA
jgi:hypothetical protein